MEKGHLSGKNMVMGMVIMLFDVNIFLAISCFIYIFIFILKIESPLLTLKVICKHKKIRNTIFITWVCMKNG